MESLGSFKPGRFTKNDPRRWQGGRTGLSVTTPDGRKRTLAELAREATFESISVLRACVNDAGEEMNTRCRAAGYLLQLGWGAAPKEVGLRLVSDNHDAASMSDAELLAIVLPALPAVAND